MTTLDAKERADMLDTSAEEIRASNTTTLGVWPDPEDKALHDRCRRLAKRLRAIVAKARVS